MKVLVLYYYFLTFPIIRTNRDMLFCFREESEHLFYYVNLKFALPFYIRYINFDAVIFHDLMLCKRTSEAKFNRIKRYLEPIKKMSAYKIAIVQDEFTHTRLLCEFLNEFSVNHVFSVAPPSEIPLIYRYLENKNIKFSHYLTGYLSNTTIRDANESAVTLNKRGIDIGYRANYNRRYSLGEHGYLKYKVAEEFQKISMHHNFNADIATDSKESKKGKEWFKFLGNCKYTIGAESGASVLDESGNIIDSVKKYIAENPNADFFETRKKLFADKEGELKLFALGPRNLEACATKTVQILIEGNYNSVLLPWKHYIPIKRDFSNLEEIIKIIKDDKLRYEIAGNAYRDIVESGNYSIKNYVKFFFNQFHIPVSKSTITGTGFFYWNFFRDKCCWIISYIAHHIWKIVEPITSK